MLLPDPYTFLIVALLLVVLLLLVLLIRRSGRTGGGDLRARLDAVDRAQERVERAIREEAAIGRREARDEERQLREELSASLGAVGDTLRGVVADLATVQATQLEAFSGRLRDLTAINEQKLESMRSVVERQLGRVQEDNARQLEAMRQTVGEKLQATLDQRLGESFRLVSDRLEQVHKGLGEMQSLASGVGDLKRVLQNVKTRGTWGEVQLHVLLEQVMAPDQYAAHVAVSETGAERVDFAIRLPGREPDDRTPVWLPIDAKFPLEDYQRLVEATDRADAPAAEQAARQLELRVKACARDIHQKYVNPPQTTDFAIMFLPTEGLYAEVLRRVGLVEHLQRDCRVIAAGPTTLWAILNSLQMGFRTLKIQQRSGEVWALLGQVKADFGKFGHLLDGVQRKLQEAATKIDRVRQSSRTIERRLEDVQAVPIYQVGSLFDAAPSPDEES